MIRSTAIDAAADIESMIANYAVLPDWQAQRIGAKMMEKAVALIGEVSPGAIVFLFTFKHGFFERLGFSQEPVSLRRL